MSPPRTLSLPLALSSWALGACVPGGAGLDASLTSDAALCVPDRALWQSSVSALAERHCAPCHLEPPTFGAPYALRDYDALVAGPPGRRPVDRIAARLVAGTMPPPGTPAPPEDAARALTAWASCGAQAPPPNAGLRASRPVLRAPVEAPAGLEAWELRASDFPVPASEPDHYQCFSFQAPFAEPRFLRRIETLLDRAEVLHHLVLFRDLTGARADTFECQTQPGESVYLYAWAPGQDAFQFPEGGLRLSPGDRYLVQLHYNNSRALADVRDRSGVRLLHGPAQGTEWGMLAYGPARFTLPPRQQTQVASACTARAPTRLLAVMPHMHQRGSSFTQLVRRASGSSESVLELSGWRFETQLFYQTPFELAAGDRLETRCGFTNELDSTVSSGSRTQDEMCFGFVYQTPPASAAYCDEPLDEAPLLYTPGACAPAGAPSSLPTLSATVRVGSPPALVGGALPQGRFELSGLEYWLSTVDTPLGRIDAEHTSVEGAGQLWLTGPQLEVDVAARARVRLLVGAGTSRDAPLRFSATATVDASSLQLAAQCGQVPSTPLGFEATPEELVLSRASASLGVQLVTRYRFRLAR